QAGVPHFLPVLGQVTNRTANHGNLYVRHKYKTYSNEKVSRVWRIARAAARPDRTFRANWDGGHAAPIKSRMYRCHLSSAFAETYGGTGVMDRGARRGDIFLNDVD